MNRTYYQQHPCGDGFGYRPLTLTVGELVAALSAHDPALPVIYRMPQYGTFGGGVTNAIGAVDRETLEARNIDNPGGVGLDEESGEEVPFEGWIDELPAWDGVVLS